MDLRGLFLSAWLGSQLLAIGTAAAGGPGNLLPPLGATQGRDPHWEMVRNQEARVDAQPGSGPQGEPLLSLKMANDAGYGEWRVSPLIDIAPGQACRAQVTVSGYAEAAPYLEVYSYADGAAPKLIGRAAGQPGRLENEVLQCGFITPADARRLRFGVGLSRAKGEIAISDASLVAGASSDPRPSPALAVSADEKPPQADWIWIRRDPGVPAVIFRKTIHLARPPASALLQVTADNAYKLSINGHPICEDTNWKTLETRDAAWAFTKGENVIEVEVDNFDDVGGLLFHARLHGADGSESPFDISSDSSWTAQKPDGSPLESLDLGPAPHAPWKSIVLHDIRPPRLLAAEVLSQTGSVAAGDVFTTLLRLRDPGALSPAQLDTLRVSVRNGSDETAISPGGIYRRLDGSTLSVEFPVSRYAMPGRYALRLAGADFVIDADLKALQVDPAASFFPALPPASWPKKPGNRAETRGGLQAPFSYATILDSSEGRYQSWQATGGHLYEIEADASADYPSSGHWELAHIERQLLQILGADPAASVQLRVRLDMPAWWLAQNPDDRFQSNAGRSGKQSFASAKWRAEAVAAVTSLVRQLWQRPAGQAVGGVLICAFHGGEFQLWGEETGEYDISPVAREAFRQWQTDASSAAPITLPQPALDLPFAPGPENERIRRLFFSFLAERQAVNIVAIARGIKADLGTGFPVSVYYGYIFEHAYNVRRLLFGGALGFQKVVDDPAVDSISCPASYALRGPGGPQAFMYPVTSVTLHNKLPVLEDDVRNFLSPHPSDSSGERLHDLASTVQSLRKIRWLAASQGALVRYLTAFSDSVDTMQDPAILAEVAALNTSVPRLESIAPGARGQVAFVVDPEALCQAGELPAALVRATLSGARRDLARLDRPIAYVTWPDWRDNAAKWRTVVIPLPGLLGQPQRAALARAFGKLPDLAPDTPFLVLDRKAGASICQNAAGFSACLGTPSSGDGDRFWYFGGNFTAWADHDSGRLEMASRTTKDKGHETKE